jgi:hypothetical protein
MGGRAMEWAVEERRISEVGFRAEHAMWCENGREGRFGSVSTQAEKMTAVRERAADARRVARF